MIRKNCKKICDKKMSLPDLFHLWRNVSIIVQFELSLRDFQVAWMDMRLEWHEKKKIIREHDNDPRVETLRGTSLRGKRFSLRSFFTFLFVLFCAHLQSRDFQRFLTLDHRPFLFFFGLFQGTRRLMFVVSRLVSEVVEKRQRRAKVRRVHRRRCPRLRGTW